MAWWPLKNQSQYQAYEVVLYLKSLSFWKQVSGYELAWMTPKDPCAVSLIENVEWGHIPMYTSITIKMYYCYEKYRKDILQGVNVCWIRFAIGKSCGVQ